MIVFGKDVETTDLGGGVRRKILSYDKEIMAVEVNFDTGSVGEVHSHLHRQVSYCVSGSFRVTIDGVTSTISAGDSFLVSPHLDHGVECLSAGTLIDVFTPMRRGFLSTEEREELREKEKEENPNAIIINLY